MGVESGPAMVDGNVGDESPAVIYAEGSGLAEWLTGPDLTVLACPSTEPVEGEVFARFRTPAGRVLNCADLGDGRVCLPFSLAEAYDSYVLERWTDSDHRRWLSAGQLNTYYRVKRLIPRRVQLAARRGLIAWKGSPAFPRWPHDDSVERLARFYGTCVLRALGAERVPFRWFWPGGAHAAAILTHDIEGPSGMRNALRIAELEEEHGFRSSFNVVGDWYPIDWGVLNELVERGHEIGSHALYHDRSLFSSRDAFERQLPLLRESVVRLGAVGFRSPATHRVPEWLGELPVDYDTTLPLSDPYEAQPGGVCSSWPFQIGDVLELPYTLPQDHTLMTLMGHRDPSLWIDQVRRIKEAFGLIQCVSHPDVGYLGDRNKQAVYREFLDFLADQDGIWHALPRDVCRWWRARAAGMRTPGLRLMHGTIVPGAGTLAEFMPPARDATA